MLTFLDFPRIAMTMQRNHYAPSKDALSGIRIVSESESSARNGECGRFVMLHKTVFLYVNGDVMRFEQWLGFNGHVFVVNCVVAVECRMRNCLRFLLRKMCAEMMFFRKLTRYVCFTVQ